MGRPSLPNLLLHLFPGQFIILRPLRYFMVNISDPLAANKRLKGVEVPSKAPFPALILSAFFYLGLRRHWRTVRARVQAHIELVSDSFLGSQNGSLSGSTICTQRFLRVSLIPQGHHWDTSLSFKQPLRWTPPGLGRTGRGGTSARSWPLPEVT